jgi:hypothetical protein
MALKHDSKHGGQTWQAPQQALGMETAANTNTRLQEADSYDATLTPLEEIDPYAYRMVMFGWA